MTENLVLPAAYPLSWPDEWPRTRIRKKSPYRVPFVQARKETFGEAQKMFHVESFVVSTNAPLRYDGRPLKVEPADPGVALWWIENRGEGPVPRVIACDRWDSLHGNMRAIGLAIGALRALQRSGASDVFERATQSFKVHTLPNARPWWFSELELVHWPVVAEDIRRAFRRLAAVRHPDKGGSSDAFVTLCNARDAAFEVIGGE